MPQGAVSEARKCPWGANLAKFWLSTIRSINQNLKRRAKAPRLCTPSSVCNSYKLIANIFCIYCVTLPSATTVVVSLTRQPYNHYNRNYNPYAVSRKPSAVVSARITAISHCFHPSLSKWRYQHPQLQSSWISQQPLPFFIKRSITRIINHKIVLLPPSQQPLFPKRLNIKITSFWFNNY